MGFLNRNKFWLGIGAGVACALALLVFIWLPWARENREALAILQDRADELRDYADDDRIRIKSEEWIRQGEERERELREILERIEADLPGRYPQFDRHFSHPETGEEGPLIVFLFVDAYEHKMQQLSGRLREAFLPKGPEEAQEGFPPEEDGEAQERFPPEENGEVQERERAVSPFLLKKNTQRMEDDFRGQPKEELHIFEREYWVQEAVLGIVIELNEDVMRIAELNKFSIQSPRTLGGTDPDMPAMSGLHQDGRLFDIWPFELEVTLRFRYLTDLLDAFAGSPVRTEVVSLSVEPLDVHDGEEMVRAKLRGYLPEYKGNP